MYIHLYFCFLDTIKTKEKKRKKGKRKRGDSDSEEVLCLCISCIPHTFSAKFNQKLGMCTTFRKKITPIFFSTEDF